MAAIEDQVKIDGDASGAQKATKDAASGLATLESKAAGVAGKVASASRGISGFFTNLAKIGTVLVSAGAGASKFGTAVGAGAGLAASALVKLNPIVGIISSVGGALLGTAAKLATSSDQAHHFQKSWEGVANQLSAPIANFAAQGFNELNRVLQDPSVQAFVHKIALVATVILNSLLPAVHAAASAVIAFFQAIGSGDIVGAFGKAIDAFKTGWAEGGKQAGHQAGASFTEGFGEKVKAAGSGGKSGGALKNIGDLGTAAINALLAGFKKADFSALSDSFGVIQTAIQTLFKKGDIKEIGIVPKIIGSEGVVARALADMQKAGGLTEAILARVRDGLKSLGQGAVDFVVATLQGVDAQKALDAATQQVAAAQAKVDAAQAGVTQKAAARLAIEHELEAAQARQADRLKELRGLQDQLQADQLALQQIKAGELPLQHRLNEITGEQRDLQIQIADLEAAQAAQLRTLAPLRQAVADAAEAQHQAELRVKQAQLDVLPIKQRLEDAQHDLNALLAQEEPLLQRQRDLAREIAHEDAEIARLQREQAAQLAALAPLREAVTAATEAQHAAEQRLKQVQAEQAAVQARITEQEQARQAVIDDLSAQEQAALAAQQAALDQIDATYGEQLKEQQRLIALIDQKWATELAGAQKALDAANRALAAAERANRKQLLQFAQQRDDVTANTRLSANEKIAALVRIDLTERKYTATQAARLDRLKLEQAVQQDTADTVKDKVDAEKAGAVTESARLQDLITQEKALIQARIDSVKKEYEPRLKALQQEAALAKTRDQRLLQAVAKQVQAAQVEATAAATATQSAQDQLSAAEKEVHTRTDGAIAEAQTRREATQVEAAALQLRLDDEQASLRDRIAAAQTELDDAQTRVDLAQRDADAAGRRTDAAQATLNSAEQEVHTRTDGAIAEAQLRSDALGREQAHIEDQIADQQAALEQRIADEQSALDLRTGTLEQQAALENRPIQDRLDAAAQEEASAQRVLELRQQDLTVAQEAQKQAQLLVDKYKEAAEQAQARVEAERQNADLIDQQRQLLQQMQQSGGGVGPTLDPGELQQTQDDIKNLWDGFWAWVTGIAVGAALTLKGVWDGITGAWDTATKDLRDVAQLTWQKIQDGLTSFATTVRGAWDTFWKGVRDSAQEIWAALQLNWQEATSKLQSSFEAARDNVVTAVSDLGTKAGKLVADLRDGVVTTVSDLRDKALGFVSGLRDGAVATVTDWRDKTVSAATDLRDKAVSAVSDLRDKVVNTASDLWTKTTTKFTQLKDDAVKAVDDLKTGALNLFGGLVTDATTKAGDIATGVVNGIISLATTGPERVKTAISGLLSGMIDAGKTALGIPTGGGDSTAGSGIAGSLIDGLVNGLANAWHKVMDKARELAESLPQPIKDALGIKSPSQELSDVGENAALGLVEGLDNIAAQVSAKATDIATSIQVSIATGLLSLADTYPIIVQQTTDFFTAWTPVWQAGVDGVRAAVLTVFGPVDQEGSLAWYLGRRDPLGWFQWWEDTARRNLEFTRLEVWQNSFTILGNETKNILNRLKEDLTVIATAIGVTLGQGLIAGLRSTFEAIAQAARDAVNTGVQSAQQAADSHSPSKRFAKEGANWGQGLVQGFGRAVTAVAGVARGAVDLAARVVATPALGTLQVPRLTLTPASAGATVAGTVPSGTAAPAPLAPSGPTQHFAAYQIVMPITDHDSDLKAQAGYRTTTRGRKR